MVDRRGEKIGWTAGWLGGFIWVAILSVVFLFQDRVVPGIAGLVLVGGALVCIPVFSPWRYPATPYWRLMLIPYLLFFGSLAWAVWSYGGLGAAGLDWWSMFWMLPLFAPLWSVGRRKWTDGNASPKQ